MLQFTSKRREVCVHSTLTLPLEPIRCGWRLQRLEKEHFAVRHNNNNNNINNSRQSSCKNWTNDEHTHTHKKVVVKLRRSTMMKCYFIHRTILSGVRRCLWPNWNGKNVTMYLFELHKKKAAHNNVVFDSSSYSHMDGTNGRLVVEWKKKSKHL